MPKVYAAKSSLVLLLLGLGSPQVSRADGIFSTLAYNVAGLLEPFSSSNPAKNTPTISCKIRGYTLINVQEDFNYHAALYDTCDDHPFRTPTSGGMGIGSGLNTLSYLPFQDLTRERWSACNGVDCLTPKGWTYTRVRLEEGVYLSVYNLHAQAQTEEADLVARRKNILQLLETIENQSPADAILVMGDTNTRYTRAGDNIEEFLKHGFRDVWIDQIRKGQVPERGAPALTECSNRTSPECEVVDKVLYRNSRALQLQPQTYLVDDSNFVNAEGEALSDHYPIVVEWSYKSLSPWKMSDLVGGPHGDFFNDLAVLSSPNRIKKLTIRAGERLDAVTAVLSNGTILSHGGKGGTERSVELAADDTWVGMELCSTVYKGRTRVGFVRFSSRLGQSLQGGQRTADCASYTAPLGYSIVGFQGRSGDAVDQLGAIYTR